MSTPLSTQVHLPIHSDSERMSGAVVFVGTRVPVQTLFDYLRDGCSIPEFLDNFPTVREEQVNAILEFAAAHILAEATAK